MARQSFDFAGAHVEFNDNSGEVLKAITAAAVRGLQACGIKARAYAMQNIQRNHTIDTEHLLRNIEYQVDEQEQAVYVGTNVEYAPYVEYGTGKYYPGGRRTPWHYQNARGEWCTTDGSEARPFLRPAAQDHAQEYAETLKESIINA